MNTQIYRNFDRRQFQDANGKAVNSIPEIAYPTQPIWKIVYRERDNAVKDMSAIVSWRAAIDYDFATATDPMSRSTPAMIISATDEDGETTISVKNDADSAPFLAAVTGQKNGERVVWFELEGYDADGESVFYDRFHCKAIMPMDPQGATEPPPDQITLWSSKAWAYALFGPRGFYYTGEVDCKVADPAGTHIYTVKTGGRFILKQIFDTCETLTGSGTPHTYKIMADDVEILPAKISGHAAVNDLDEDHMAYGKYLPAGTVIKVVITNASTFPAHTAKFAVAGWLMENGITDGAVDTPTPGVVQLTHPNGDVYQLYMNSDNSTEWRKVV